MIYFRTNHMKVCIARAPPAGAGRRKEKMELKEDLMEIVQNKRKRRIEVVRMKQEKVGEAYTDTAPWDKPEKVIEIFSPFLGDSAVECFFCGGIKL